MPELWQASVLDWTASEEADQISLSLNARGVWTSVKGLSWGGAERLIFAWGEAIAAARAAFARCQFDDGACDLGLRWLRAYRKEWDEGLIETLISGFLKPRDGAVFGGTA